MKRVEFRLTIPGCGSWNSRWSGEGNDYLIFKNMPDKKCDELGITNIGDSSWGYS